MTAPHAEPSRDLPKYALLGYLVFFVIISLLRLKSGPASYNNFHIFVNSFEHLAKGSNLYDVYPAEGLDLFKYSPSFAFFMYPFTLIPRPLGLVLWNLMNVLVFWAGVNSLRFGVRQKALVLGVAFLPLIGSTQNAQSNALMAGLMLLAFTAIESQQTVRSAAYVCFGAFTKLFALALVPSFLVFYKHKLRLLFSMSVVTAVLLLVPAFMIGLPSLIQQYANWIHLLANEGSGESYSLFRLIEATTGYSCSKRVLVLSGAMILLAPLFKPKECRTTAFRDMMFSSILIWVVIFNHRAESPTYIISAVGVAIWFLTQPRTFWSMLAVAFYVALSDLALSDLVPNSIQDAVIRPYSLKALPASVIWICIEWQLFTYRPVEQTARQVNGRVDAFENLADLDTRLNHSYSP